MPDYLSEPATSLFTFNKHLFLSPLGWLTVTPGSWLLYKTMYLTHWNLLNWVLTRTCCCRYSPTHYWVTHWVTVIHFTHITTINELQTISSIYYIWLTILTSISFWHPLQTRVSNFTLRKILTLCTTFQLVIITHTLTIIFLTIHLLSAQHCTIYCLKLTYYLHFVLHSYLFSHVRVLLITGPLLANDCYLLQDTVARPDTSDHHTILNSIFTI